MNAYLRICGEIRENEESGDVPPHDLNELGVLLFGEWFFVSLINGTLVVFV